MSLIQSVAIILEFSIGNKVQVYFGGKCGFRNAKAEYGCPLPDFFNHNVLMHIIQVKTSALSILVFQF